MSLEQLKTLRTRRMEQCYIQLQEQRRIFAAHQQQVEQHQQQLANFHHWRLQHQEDLFHGLQNQTFEPQALLDYQSKLEQFQQQEEYLKHELSNAQEALKQVESQVQTAQQESNEAVLKLEKVKEVIQQQPQQKPLEEPVQ